MPDIVQDPLRGLSDAVVDRVRQAQPLVARIEVAGRPMRCLLYTSPSPRDS